jgi:aryl-phospho-beta-D-glucosidase BglC (GH1 family)
VKRLITRLTAKGIGTLIDLHALPGGANGGDHSGTNSGKAELWKSKKNLDLATRCLLFIAKEARSMEGVIGLQLVNEADWDAPGMYGWYDSVIGQIVGIDNTVPLYISDAWNLGPAVGYINGKNSLHAGRANPIVIDTHLYWAFSDDDKKKNPSQIANEARSKLSELDGHDGNVVDNGAAQVVVGEYSCVMTEDSWAKASANEKENLVREFGQAQTQRFQQKTGGSFFWTYRMVRFLLTLHQYHN